MQSRATGIADHILPLGDLLSFIYSYFSDLSYKPELDDILLFNAFPQNLVLLLRLSPIIFPFIFSFIHPLPFPLFFERVSIDDNNIDFSL